MVSNCNCNEFAVKEGSSFHDQQTRDNKHSTNTNQQSSKTKLVDWLVVLFVDC